MPTRFSYSTTVSNEYLGISKEIKGSTQWEVQFKAKEQLRKWDLEEQRRKERDRIADLKSKAEFDSEEAQTIINAYRSLLTATLSVNDRLDWGSLRRNEPFGEAYPIRSRIDYELSVPRENKILERFLPFLQKERLRKEQSAQLLFEERTKAYEKAKAEYEREQEEYNLSVEQFRSDFEQGHTDAIIKYVHLVLERSQYPKGLDCEYDIQFDPISGIIVIDLGLPNKSGIPRTTQYRFLSSKKEILPIDMKDKEFDIFYEDCLYQICLRTIHEVFESVYIDTVKAVVFNGWVRGLDPRTGQEFHACIISCQTSRDEFQRINLRRVSPKECFRHLKGLSAGPLAQLAPVRPIMELRRDDPRFIAPREVLTQISEATNLATMDWADFEHLVRELFEAIFSRDGGEVKVTQASRDGGVDAIAFDPDPIRGGKFVIQAKRYNGVVQVSAVRDLYGTMIAEGATKGILVTTSYYGNDSREFVKDKPITLIDGANLIHMFQEHGHNVTIQLRSRTS